LAKSWQLAKGSWQLIVDNGKLVILNWQVIMKVGSWQSKKVGKMQKAVGKNKS
jgi:hypothetical protein